MKLFWKGLLLVAVPTLFELVALLFLLSAQREAVIADGWSLHTAEVLNMSSAILEPLLGEAVRFRGAELAEMPSLADDAFWDGVDQKVSDLTQLVSDNPSQVQRARGIREMTRLYRAALAKTYAIGQAGGRDALRDRYRPGGGVEVLEKIRVQFAQFQAEEHRLSEARRAIAKEARERQQVALYIIVLLSLVIGVLTLYVYNRSVGMRLEAVIRNAELLAKEEPLAERVGGRDEITLVDETLHRAADELREKARLKDIAEQELAKRNEVLSLMNEDLRQQRQDNEMFVYSVSHDLRSPLVNLEGFSKELAYSSTELRDRLNKMHINADERAGLEQILDTDFEPALRYVSAAVTQASRIIDALLKLSRVGRIELHEENIDMAAMVGTLIDATTRTIRGNEVTLEVKDLPPMVGDSAAVSQIFSNLINNAIYYRDKSRLGRIEIGGESNGQDVSYYVRDNGLGMSEQQQAKLFIAFKRFHPEVAQGEGIGLAYVKRVVEKHSGRITVQSTVGEGSTFFVHFPGRSVKE